jgi:N,N-dimethylformamidase
MKSSISYFSQATCLILQTFFFFSSPSVHGVEKVKFSPHVFTLPDGYALKQVAAPPLVKRPVHMYFDDDGSLYVTDSSGNTDKAPKQLNNPTHRVLRLVDRDGDGAFDQSTVFAERLPFPEGILVHEGSVYVGAPPHIWKFTDTDGDHVADERTVWFDGGSIEGCGNDLHGPYLGPDGFFYWCKGAFAPQSHVLGNGKTFKSSAAHIYRARPDGTQLEVVITGGMNNPVGLAFSESGERFLSGTFFDLSKPGRRDGILHAVYGGTYGKRNDRVLSPHPSSGGLLPVLSHMGPSASSGIVMPLGKALGMRGDLLCADFNLRRISRHRLSRDGSTYSALMSVLLESDQSDFHPTDVIEDADGSLLVADTGSWYMICCPTSKVAKPDVLGSIYRIERKNASSPKDPRGLELDWTKPQVDWLSDQRPAVVKRAIETLAKLSNVDQLIGAKARIPALWTLHGISGKDARVAVRDFLRDEKVDAQMAAVHSAGLWRDPEAVMPLVELLASDDASLRRLAAMALGRIGDRRAVKPLLAAGLVKTDPFLKHAITYALYEIGDEKGLPADHPMTKQVGLMHKIDKRSPSKYVMPEIQLADAVKPDPDKEARQGNRLDQLAGFLPKGNPVRGEKLFHDATKSLCITCHVKGDNGVDFGPDLTRIGAIRSERDLLEAIVYPSSTIARYYELLIVQKKQGEAAGLLRRDSVDEIVLGPAPGVEQSIPMKEIKGAKYSNVSLMPEVFDNLLKPEQIADLVAYLKEAKGPVASFPTEDIPSHHAINLPGLHAYAQKSIAAGEEIEFRVSSTVPYDLSVVKLGADPENRDKDPVLQSFQVEQPQAQPIHPGSYLHVAKSLPVERRLSQLSLECWIRPFKFGQSQKQSFHSGSYLRVAKALPVERRLSQLTLECWIRPFKLSGWQGLITQHDYPKRCGVGLFLSEGTIVFGTGGGGGYDATTFQQTKSGLIKAQQWHHLVGSWDGRKKRVFVDGQLAAEIPFAGMVRPGATDLRVGAYAQEGESVNFFNGDVAMCAIYDRALSEDQIKKRFADRGLTTPKGDRLLACWPFTEERGVKVADVSGFGRDARIINRGTWMIGGPSFNANASKRNDPGHDPVKGEKRGHGLRLADDKIYNIPLWTGLVTQHDYPERCGVGLFLSEDRIIFGTGGGGLYDASDFQQTKPGLIKTQRWHHLVGSWDGKKKRIYIDGKLAGEAAFADTVRPGKTALRIGAYGQEGEAVNFYNGDIAMCAIYDRALSEDQVKKRFSDRGLNVPKDDRLLACWPFTEERGKQVADASDFGRDGRIINRGTWMIGGPSFNASAINRHDSDYDPTKDEKRGHGLRLATDEIYNARWKVSHRFRVPADAKSGVYAGRFDFKLKGKSMRYHTSFIVRRPEYKPKAPLLVLVSSNTWLAYNSVPFPVNHGKGLVNMGTGGLANSHPGAPKYSFYSDHRNGQPTYKVGLKVPWPAGGPNKTYIGGGYSHLLRGERFLHLWLDKHGYEYDVITDRDLDRNPEILKRYKAVLVNGHSEYWSARAYDGLDDYLNAGGAAVVMSGNTMFWRVSFDETGEVMECRKFGGGIGGRRLAKVGELYHSHDFKRGSLMRFCGYPAWKLVGLECIGWGGGNFANYQVDVPDHFLFAQPHKTGLKKGDPFGFTKGKTGAVGHEYDVRLSTLLRATKNPALKGLVEPEGIVTIASSQSNRNILDFNAVAHSKRVGDEQTIAEIIYWERPQGGRVFHTGSIATAWAMYYDESLSNLVRNVLHHFKVKPKK